MYNVVVLSDEQLAWIKKAVKMYQANGKTLDTFDAAGAVAEAEKVETPTIQDWMAAKYRATVVKVEHVGDIGTSLHAAVERFYREQEGKG